MRGMHRDTGKTLSGEQHLKQSLQDLLTTPLGSRVMRPDYGSRLFELIDAPLNQTTLAELYTRLQRKPLPVGSHALRLLTFTSHKPMRATSRLICKARIYPRVSQ